MWKMIFPYWGTLLPFVLLSSTLDFTYAMNQQKYKSQHISEIDIEKANDVIRGSTRMNYIRQSLNPSNEDPFITVEMVAPDLPPVECVSGSIGNANGSIAQPFEMCDGWDGSEKDITIPHAELPAEMEVVHIFIMAYNKSSKTIIDVSEMDFNSSAFGTNVAIVGSESMATNASLRVHVGNNEEDVSVGDETCVKGKTCYYPYTEQNIKERRKEIDVQGNTENFKIPQYDNSIMPFIKLEGDVSVSVSAKGTVKISTTLPETDLMLEVVVYDQKDTQNILSKDDNYKCAVSQISDKSYQCSQEIKMTKDLVRVWVLVVAISVRDNSVVQSIRVNVPISTEVEGWVIALSVSLIVGFAAFTLIGMAILVTWKKRNNRNQERDLTSQGNNVTTENNSNLPNESCYENEVENENEDEKKSNYEIEEDNQQEDKEDKLKEEEDQQKNKEENLYEEIKENQEETMGENHYEVIKENEHDIKEEK